MFQLSQYRLLHSAEHMINVFVFYIYGFSSTVRAARCDCMRFCQRVEPKITNFNWIERNELLFGYRSVCRSATSFFIQTKSIELRQKHGFPKYTNYNECSHCSYVRNALKLSETNNSSHERNLNYIYRIVCVAFVLFLLAEAKGP